MIIERTKINVIDKDGMTIDCYYEYESTIKIKRRISCDADEYTQSYLAFQMKSDIQALLECNTIEFVDKGNEVKFVKEKNGEAYLCY